MKQWECKRCEHKWIPRTDKKPVQCPVCHSVKWDEAKVKV